MLLQALCLCQYQSAHFQHGSAALGYVVFDVQTREGAGKQIKDG